MNTKDRALQLSRIFKTNSNVKDTAIALTQAGYSITPVRALTDKTNPKAPGSDRRSRNKDEQHHYSKDYPIPAEAVESFFNHYTKMGIGLIVRKGIVIIDADTPDEVELLKTWWKDTTGKELPETSQKTPGGGKHSNGGHWIVSVPEEFPIGGNTKIRSEDGTRVDVFTEKKYALCSPTKRHVFPQGKTDYDELSQDEKDNLQTGTYEFSGEVIDSASYPGLIEAIADLSNTKQDSTPSRNNRESVYPPGSIAEAIEQWKQDNSWEDVLNRVGWKIKGKECSGNCYRFKYPTGNSDTSGIAHDDSCTNLRGGNIKMFSGTAADDLDLHDGNTDRWGLIVKVIYNGDPDAAYLGEGIRGNNDSMNSQGNSSTHNNAEAQNTDNDSVKETHVEAGLRYCDTHHKLKAISNDEVLWTRKDGHIYNIDYSDLIREVKTKSLGIRGKVLSDRAANDVYDIVYTEAKEQYNSQPVSTHVRTNRSKTNKHVYINMGERTGVIRITNQGWVTVPASELPDDIAFIASQSVADMQADANAEISDIDQLFKMINIPERMYIPILTSMITGWVTPEADPPIVIMSGDPGSGKSTSAVIIKMLVDKGYDGFQDKIVPPDNKEEFILNLNQNAAVVFDNTTSIPRNIQNLLSSASTGAKYKTRTLFRTTHTTTTDLKKLMLFTTVQVPSLKTDFKSRIIYCQVEPLSKQAKENSKGKFHLEESFYAVESLLRGSLLKLTAEVASRYQDYKSDNRLDDVGLIAQAITDILLEHGLDYGDGRQQLSAAQDNLHDDSRPNIIDFLITYPHTYSDKKEARIGELLTMINTHASLTSWNKNTWKDLTPSGLSKMLKNEQTIRILSAHYDIDYRERKDKDGNVKDTFWMMKKIAKNKLEDYDETDIPDTAEQILSEHSEPI